MTKSGVGAVVREDNPQVITLEVESTAGSYTLIVTKRGIALWDGKANKQLWGINA